MTIEQIVPENTFKKLLTCKCPLEAIGLYTLIRLNEMEKDAIQTRITLMNKTGMGRVKFKRTMDELIKKGFVKFKRPVGPKGFESGSTYKTVK